MPNTVDLLINFSDNHGYEKEIVSQDSGGVVPLNLECPKSDASFVIRRKIARPVQTIIFPRIARSAFCYVR